MTDAIGNELRVGDYVTYPGRQGSSLWLNFGKILEKKMIKAPGWHRDEKIPILIVNRTSKQWKEFDKPSKRRIECFGIMIKIEVTDELRQILQESEGLAKTIPR